MGINKLAHSPFQSIDQQRYLLWHGYQFFKDNSSVKARKLFFATLIYLPVMLVLMIIHKVRQPANATLIENTKDANKALA